MIIRPLAPRDVVGVVDLWNECVRDGEVVYAPITPDSFHQKFELDPNYDPRFSLVAEEDGEVAGFVSGIAKKIFLDRETNENTPGYITCFFVRRAFRGRGIGRALIEALCARFAQSGKRSVAISNDNPVNLDWRIPGTPGHDHNNTPGVDTECPGFGFAQALGFTETTRDIAMYLNLADYVPWAGLAEKRAELLAQGIYTGRYDASLGYDYDLMCDRVGSEYWRAVIRSELSCWRENRPNTDVRFIPNGTKVPAGPRPLLVATCDRHIVAFTGPVDKQDSGRGWFCGITTDPTFERRGIASVLFNLLMEEFIAEGAAFSTLFTGDSNHAQRIYKRAGFQVVRRFAIMQKTL